MSADSQFPVPPQPGETPMTPEEESQYLENPQALPDYSIKDIHEPVMRERKDPQEGREPVSLWLILSFAVVLFCGGAYLMRYSGGFDGNVYDENQVAYGPQKGGGAAVQTVDPVAVGKRLYTINCASCHQATGQGAQGQYPPLAGSDVVLCKNGYGSNHLVRIMLDGLVGQINVSGSLYNGNMPAWAGNLKDDQIAYILTFIRQEWGNKADPINPKGVAAVRTEVAAHTNPWTDEELKKIPAASVPAGDAAPATAAPASPGNAAPAGSGAPVPQPATSTPTSAPPSGVRK